jgi:hypothetical protein
MIAQERGQYEEALADLEAYLALPSVDDDYRAIAERTVILLRDIVTEMPPEQSEES